jgi:magnesium chelatase family protein
MVMPTVTPWYGRAVATDAPPGDVNAFALSPSSASPPRLVRRLTPILPLITLAEAIETTRVHSISCLAGGRTALDRTRPFRGPHHTISDAGPIAMGQMPMSSDVSLAHHGIFFLNEQWEFRRHVREVFASRSTCNTTAMQ